MFWSAYKSNLGITVVSGILPSRDEPAETHHFIIHGLVVHLLCLSTSHFDRSEVEQARDMIVKCLRWKLPKYAERYNPSKRDL